MHELPLVFFTVFGQAAAGMMLIALISQVLGWSSREQALRINLVAMILMAVGMALGGTHMGQPLRAINMMLGLGRSPMSNEIFLSGAFFGLGALAVLLEKLEKGAEGFRRLVQGLAVIAGILFVWSIPQVYQLNTVNTWSSDYTSLQMFLTSVVAGGALAAALGARKLGSVSLMVGAIASFALQPGYFSLVNGVAPELAAGQMNFWTLQSLLMAVGVVLVASQMTRKVAAGSLLSAASLLVLSGELAARVAFYSLHTLPM